MYKLTALEAISPALQRTREVLFSGRGLKTSLKIALVATLAAMGDGLNMRFNSSGDHNSIPNASPHMTAILASIAAAAVFIAIVFAIIYLVLFYVGNRMQFVLFDMVLHRRTTVAPAWRAYASRTWRWIGIKLLVFLALLTACVLAAWPMVVALVREHTVHSLPRSFAHLFLGSLIALAAVFIIFFIFSALLHDFVLPAVALEDARIFPTMGRLGTLCAAEPGQIALYLLLRLIFAVLMVVATFIAVIVVAIVVAIVLGLAGVIAFAILHKLGVGGMVVLGIFIIAEIIVGIAILLLADVCIVGWYMTFQQAWSIFFLAGRYTLLGQWLDASIAPPAPAYAYAGSGFPPPPSATPAYPPPQSPIAFTTADYAAPPAQPMAAEVGAFGEGSGTSGGEGQAEQRAHHEEDSE